MKAESVSWSRSERVQVGLVGAAPAAVVALLAVAGVVFVGKDALFLAMLALPLAYGTLFLSVLPALTFLRRYRSETMPYFVLTVSIATLLPWALVYGLYWLVIPLHEQPPASLAALTLLAPTFSAGLVAIAVWLLGFRAKNAA